MRRVLLTTLFATATAHAAPIGAVAELDRSIVRVGDAVIWESEVAARVKAGADRAAVIESMIDDELVLAEGKSAGITADRTDVLAALDEIKKQNNFDDAQLDKALAEAGFTRARYLVDLERQLVLLRTKNQLVSPKVTIETAEVTAELTSRKLPITEDNKETVKRELWRAALDKAQAAWIAGLRKHALIRRRP